MTQTDSPTMTSFNQLWQRFNWRPIRNCPGRFVLADKTRKYSVQDLLGDNVVVQVFATTTAPDPVHLAMFVGGGLLSYEKVAGRFVHTLNTVLGLQRKLDDLGIPLAPIDR